MPLSLGPAPKECELFGDFGWFIQLTLGLLSFSSLIVKRYLEKSPRPWKIWFMDTSKQGFSSSLLHLLNLYLSHSAGSGQQCTWYFLNFTIDTFLGMSLCYLLLNALEKCLQSSPRFAFKSGYYGESGKYSIWAYQLFLWLCIIFAVKLIIWLTMNLLSNPLQGLGNFLLFPLQSRPQLELVMVMIIIPLLMNSLLFWVTDNYLKSNKDPTLDCDVEMRPENITKFLSNE